MNSTSKKKFKEAAQQQILSNYYLSKYDRFMARYNQKSPQAPEPAKIISKQKPMGVHNQKQRKNFKQVMRQRKYTSKPFESELAQKKESGAKNFRVEIEKKNSKQKIFKENRANFYQLEGSIIKELYTPSPSQIESGKFTEIEVKHKTSFEDRQPKPFILIPTEQEENIQIKYYGPNEEIREQSQFKEEEIQFENGIRVESEREEYNLISSAIRSSFQRRSPKSRNSSPKKNDSLHRFPPKYLSPNVSSEYNDSSLIYDNIRSNFQSMDRRKISSSNRFEKEFEEEKRKLSEERSDRKNARHSREKSFDKNSVNSHLGSKGSKNSQLLNKSKEGTPGSSKQKSIKYSDRKSSYDDSLNQFIPSLNQAGKDESVSNIQIKEDFQQLYDRPPSELRESTHQLSMISRFSMTSDEGGLIREHLERELNENQFGPYQHALTNLHELIQFYPHAWPIFVVGQRILEDRQQYDLKRSTQQTQMSKLASQINQLKKTQKHQLHSQSQVSRNGYIILRLIRDLASKLN